MNELPRDFEMEVNDAVRFIEKESGLAFGDEENPLLLKIRGSEEYKYTGLSRDTVEGYGRYCGSLHQAYLLYMRYLVNFVYTFYDEKRHNELHDIYSESELMKEFIGVEGKDETIILDDYIALDELKRLVMAVEDKFLEVTGREVPTAEEQLKMVIERAIEESKK